ncbi:MAG: hypothetical protein ACHQX1_01200 [Candidatus Micrarchaeales archaeon]
MTSASKTLSLAIRCGANLLPVKGLLYAMAHAKSSRHVTGSSKSGAAETQRKLAKYMKELATLATDLQSMKEVSGSELYRHIRLATISYVDLFYSLEGKERDLYLTSCVGHHGKKIENENNLLLIPAIMASRGEPKSHVTSFLVNNIYKIPFRVLYHSSKAAIHIELLQQAMGLKNAPDSIMKRFSETLTGVESIMQSIEEGEIKPEEDEVMKQDFVEEAVTLSQSTDMKIADFISEKIMPNAFTDRMAKKIIRKL